MDKSPLDPRDEYLEVENVVLLEFGEILAVGIIVLLEDSETEARKEEVVP